MLFLSLQDELAAYGIDWNGSIPTVEDAEHVVVPQTIIPLSDDDYEELQGTIAPKCLSTKLIMVLICT